MKIENQLINARVCPICGGRPVGQIFPFATRFNSIHFGYLKCGKCKSCFVAPVPNQSTFQIMYAKVAYHDCHYKDNNVHENYDYRESVKLLMKYLDPSSKVLDYGCGTGGFLKALRTEGFVRLVGVEFDRDAALFAAHHTGCEVLSVEAFNLLNIDPLFDSIHLGDVLEHLPDPQSILTQLVALLKPGGVLFIEGPLETNPSPVFWVARLFGSIKRLVKPTFLADDPPTHLFRTHANAQKAFFVRVAPLLSLHHWKVYETGWPYSSGGFLKRCISSFATLIGGRRICNTTFGNRFEAIFVKS